MWRDNNNSIGQPATAAEPQETAYSWSPLRVIAMTLFGLMGFSILVSLCTFTSGLPSNGIWSVVRAWQFDPTPIEKDVIVGPVSKEDFTKEENIPLNDNVILHEKLLGGLLPSGLDESSCQSRYKSFVYRKGLQHQPSSHLISRLRLYEALHKKCGPNTESYNRTLENLRSGHYTPSGCNYVVWVSFSGLGNRILTLASAFLYALLTNRVLLVDPGNNMPDLFCEPFPNTSWFLPPDFPLITMLSSYNQSSPECYGNMRKNNVVDYSNTSKLPYALYLYLVNDYDDHDKLFFCNEDQNILKRIPWLIMKTDNYFAPSLFLITSFEQELNDLFPDKETVFHHLGRYLFHPTNPVWGLITRYYQAYLDKADEKIGIQVRVFDPNPGPFKHVLDQIVACTLKENLLPQVNMEKSVMNKSENQKHIAVLMTSLSSGYSDDIRNMYLQYPTVNGELISVHQPSSEIHQQTEKKMHNRKAWAEMYLLSLTDKLVTSARSTFGYVAQGLGGLKPWILYRPESNTVPDPPCQRVRSLEPCSHSPPFYDCNKKTWVDPGKLVPYVQHCEDVTWGIKLVGNR